MSEVDAAARQAIENNRRRAERVLSDAQEDTARARRRLKESEQAQAEAEVCLAAWQEVERRYVHAELDRGAKTAMSREALEREAARSMEISRHTHPDDFDCTEGCPRYSRMSPHAFVGGDVGPTDPRDRCERDGCGLTRAAWVHDPKARR